MHFCHGMLQCCLFCIELREGSAQKSLEGWKGLRSQCGISIKGADAFSQPFSPNPRCLEFRLQVSYACIVIPTNTMW